MIIQKAKETLEKLRRTTNNTVPDFGMDSETELIIRVISNECKSTALQYDVTGKMSYQKYGSEIIRDNIDTIIRQLILNGNIIPKEVMSKIMYSHGCIVGINSDLHIYKGIREDEKGNLERIATVGKAIIEINNPVCIKLINEEIYRNFARQLILSNYKKLPKQNIFKILKEKVIHGKEDREFLTQKYIKILKEHTSYNDEIIRNTVEYNLDYIYNQKFMDEVINNINNSTGILPLKVAKKGIPFESLLNSVSAEIQDIANTIPDINEIYKDIEQIYADTETQLIAYSTDISKLNKQQILQLIKDINETSLKDPNLCKYLGKDGFRNAEVGISNTDIDLVKKENVAQSMENLSKDIYELVKNKSNLTKEDYIQKAIMLQYRFLRIHPFPDSNGRTSRALLNMITLQKGILVEFPKEIKNEYIEAMNDTHIELNKQNYLQLICDDSEELKQIEDSIKFPIHKFIENNCLINLLQENEKRDKEKDEIIDDLYVNEL